MKPEQLSDALNHLPDDLLQEAEQSRQRRHRRPGWQRWGALAACLALAALAGSRLFPWQTIPRPGDSPRPGSSGPSQPQPGGQLPLLTIGGESTDSRGFEGYLALDISELGGANPWTEEAEVASLPVYQNPLTYNEQHQAQGADWEQMRALLLRVAGELGLDTDALTVDDNAPDESYQQAIRDKFAAVGDAVPEGYFDPTALTIQGEGVRVEVDQTLTATIRFEPPVALPPELNFTHYASREEKKAAADWLAERYSGLLSGMEKPVLDQGMGDRNIYSQQSFDVEYYDGAGSLEEQMVSYSFYRTAFYCDDNGELFLARVYAPDLSQKLGDYPIITAEAARELLLAGHYATSVPCALPGEESIAKVELVYRAGTYEQVWLPYYRFLAELPKELGPADPALKDYGAYYVPAVEGKYIANMPTYDGGFNK